MPPPPPPRPRNRDLTALEIARNKLAAARRNGSPGDVVSQLRAALAEQVLCQKITEVLGRYGLPAEARNRLAALVLTGAGEES